MIDQITAPAFQSPISTRSFLPESFRGGCSFGVRISKLDWRPLPRGSLGYISVIRASFPTRQPLFCLAGYLNAFKLGAGPSAKSIRAKPPIIFQLLRA